MKYFTLNESESILYQSTASVGETPAEATGKKAKECEIFLTNEHLFVVTVNKRLFQKDEASVKKYPMKELKTYRDQPQINNDHTFVSACFSCGEVFFVLPNKKEAAKLVSLARQTVTGESKAVREIHKAKKNVGEISDALGVNAANVARGAFNIGIAFAQGGAKGALGVLSQLGGTIKTKREQEHEKLQIEDEQIHSLTKWKALLDSGAISQEEFEEKKREIMNKSK